jgi:hypothetical protein
MEVSGMDAKSSVALVQLTFDYEANAIVATKDVKSLEKHAKAICDTVERVRKTTAEGVMKLGAEMAAAHAILSNHGDGTFGKWCLLRCGISRVTAHKAINVFKQFDYKPGLQTFDPTALYLLSAPSCPEEATAEAIERAEHGERITTKLARDIIKSHSPEADEEEDDEPETFDWQPVECFTSIRAEVRRWLLICPSADRKFILETLQDIAAQIERKTSE